MKSSAILTAVTGLLAFTAACLPPERDFTAPAVPAQIEMPEYTNGEAANALTSGVKEPGSAVFVNGELLVDYDQDWTDIALPQPVRDALQAGDNTLVFTARDRVGNVSGPTNDSIGLDRVPPLAAPTVTSPLFPDYVDDGLPVITWDEVVDDPTEFSGIATYLVEFSTSEAFDQVDYTENTLGQTSTATVTSALPVGRYWFRVAAVDQAGNRTASDGATSLLSGVAGDVNGDRYPEFAVGAPGRDAGAIVDQGAAYLYFGGGAVDLSQPSQEVTGSGDSFGAAAKIVADLNGDGIGDLVVGAPAGDGMISIFFGEAGGVSTTANVTIAGPAASEFGFAFDVADHNLDGYGDLVVGAPNGQVGANNPGVAFFFYGRPDWSAVTDASTHADAVIEGETDGDRFGESVAIVGLVTQDATPDVIVGAPFRPVGMTEYGQAYVIGVSNPPPPGPIDAGLGFDLVDGSEGFGAFAHFGKSVDGGIDIDGDGFNEVIVGGPAEIATGVAMLYYVANTTTACTMQGALSGADFGWSVALVERLGGDIATVVGAPGDSGNFGGVIVSTWDAGAGGRCDFMAPNKVNATVAERLGESVASAGDLDQDGDIEIIAGAPSYSGLRGRAYLFQRGASLTGSPFEPVLTDAGALPARVGASVGGAR